MQRHGPRHFTAYTITAILYLLVIAAIYYSQTQHFVSSKESKEKVIQMSLSTFVPEVLELPKKVVEEVIEEPIEEKVIEKEVKEEPKVEEVIPEPIVEKIIEKPIVKKPKVEKKKIIKETVKKKKPVKKIKKKIVKKKKIKTKKRKKKASKRQASSKQSKSTPAQRNKFWSALRAKIDRHKFYPRIAKKRRMEGSVKVRFTILSSGNVGNISLKGPKIFYNSARNAVKSAFPIEAKKSPISLPTTINLTLRYQIR
jgi:protein TonB